MFKTILKDSGEGCEFINFRSKKDFENALDSILPNEMRAPEDLPSSPSEYWYIEVIDGVKFLKERSQEALMAKALEEAKPLRESIRFSSVVYKGQTWSMDELSRTEILAAKPYFEAGGKPTRDWKSPKKVIRIEDVNSLIVLGGDLTQATFDAYEADLIAASQGDGSLSNLKSISVPFDPS